MPPGHEASNAVAPPPWRLPAEVLDGLGRWFEAPWQMSTDVGGIALRPRACDEGSTGLGMTGVGEGTLPAALTAGVCRGDQPQAFQQWSGVIDACEVSPCSHGGDGHDELDATQRLERCDDRRYTPGLGLVLACWFQTPEACRVCVDRAHVVLEDALLGGGVTDHRREPSEMGRTPLAWPVSRRSCRSQKAFRRNFAALRSRRASSRARVRSRMASSSSVGTSTGVRAPERIRRASCTASRRSVCTRAPALFGMREGATTQPSSPLWHRERSSQEPHGPAS